MGEKTTIGWTDHTYNAWWGCSKISSGCKLCYASSFSHHYNYDVFGYQDNGNRKELRVFGEKHWAEPLKWHAEAVRSGTRKRIFSASMSDVFDDHPATGPLRERLWALIQATPMLDWQLLTKRPEHILDMLPENWGAGYPNVWLGTSVENQAATHRIQTLARVPARVRFLSCEPLIGPLDLGALEVKDLNGQPVPALAVIDWVIIGGESGAGARPMRPEWVDQILEDCARHPKVRAFVKQMGGVLARQMGLTHAKGEDPAEWPDHWQVQTFPEAGTG